MSAQAATRSDLGSPSDLAATGGRHFAGSLLKAPVPPGVEREILALLSEDGALHDAMAYRPIGVTPTTGVILMHPVASFMQHYALGPLAERGYLALGVASRFTDESNAILEHVVLDLASAVRYLREQHCERVVLIGNSGGGGLSTFYQAEAEGPTVITTPGGDPLDLTTADLPPAHALILLNAHRGRAQVLTRYLDPSVVDEHDPVATDPTLDMFNPDNGPPYDEEFVIRYRAAQIARNERITRWAQARLAELRDLGGHDQAFVVHRTTAALEFLDRTLDPSDRPPGWYGGGVTAWYNRAAAGLGRFSTLHSWLSQWGLRTTNGLAEPSLGRITVPLLVIQATADQGVFPADARSLYDAAGTADKNLQWVDGGLHFFSGQPELQRDVIDRIVAWLSQRGMGPTAGNQPTPPPIGQ